MEDLGSTRPYDRSGSGPDRSYPGRFDLAPAVPSHQPAAARRSEILASQPGWRPVGADAAGLREVLRGGSSLQRLAAVSSLRPGPGVEAALVEALDDPEFQVRAGAVRAFAAVARARGTRALLRVSATDPAPEVRAAAVAALAGLLEHRIGPEEAAGSS